jgi:capsular exopolysaccharide synthesis family protein
MAGRDDLDGTASLQHDIGSVLTALRRRLPLILLLGLLAGGAAAAVSFLQTEQYTATASLLFRDPKFGEQLFGGSVFEQSDPDREAATNVTLVSLRPVSDRTSKALNGQLTSRQISDMVTISAEANSDVVAIEATDSDPERAAEVANAFATSYVAFRRDADRRKVAEARDLLEHDYAAMTAARQQSEAGRALQTQLSDLDTLKALQTGNAEVVQTAEPPANPSSPRIKRNIAVGIILGLLIGVALALLIARLDRRILDVDQLTEVFDLPLLSDVPASDVLASSQTPASLASLPVREGEAFRMLQTRLRYFNIDQDIQKVMVTSAAPGDGKSTTAMYLARAAAASGTSTIFIEADFHHPTAGRRAPVDPFPGLSELLTHQRQFHEVVQQVDVSEASSQSDGRRLDVITAGTSPPNPAELLDSQEMRRLIEELGGSYDMVVIDTPPLPLLADAIPITNLVDGVIVVARVEKTTRDEASRLRAQLTELNAPVLGVVANGVGKRSGYGYGYGYSRSGEANTEHNSTSA